LKDEELLLEAELATWREQPHPESAELSEKLVRQLKGRNDLFRLNRHFFEMMWAQLDWADYERAVETCDSGIKLAKEIGIPPVQYSTLKALAQLQLGRFGEAWDSLQNEVVDQNHPFGQAMQLLGLAQYYWELQSIEESERACRDLQHRAARLRRAWMSRRASSLLARSLARRMELDSPSRNEIDLEVKHLGEMIPREVTAEILLAEAKPEAALREATTLAGEAEAGGHIARLLEAHEILARTLLCLNRSSEAGELLQRGCEIAHERRALSIEWRLLALRGQAFQAQRDVVSAKGAFREAAAVVGAIGDSIQDAETKARFLASPSVAFVMENSK
jgi:tetratricopeptide (TPR) repeat protein